MIASVWQVWGTGCKTQTPCMVLTVTQITVDTLTLDYREKYR